MAAEGLNAVEILRANGWKVQPGFFPADHLVERRCQAGDGGFCQLFVGAGWREDRASLCCPKHTAQAKRVTA